MKKLLIIFFIGTIISILIYNITRYKKTDILIIGDSIATGDTIYGNSGINFNLYLKDYLKDKNLGNYDLTYTKNNLTIKDFNYQFTENNEINDKHIQNRISESEIIIIALGQDELISKSMINRLKYNDRKEFYKNYEQLLINLRNVSKKDIFIIGLYSDKINQLNEIENNIISISQKYNVNYIKINNVISKNDLFDKNSHLNYNGHKKIFELLKEQIRL